MASIDKVSLDIDDQIPVKKSNEYKLLTKETPSKEEVQTLIEAWLAGKAEVLSGAESLTLSKVARPSLVKIVQAQREKDIYPNQKGYIAGPLAPPPARILNQPEPLPEEVRGDAWSFALLPLGTLLEANEWPIEFSGLLPIKEKYDLSIQIPGLRLFSKSRALALAGWLGGLEPVKLVIEGNQLLLEAGQDDRWLVTDMTQEASKEAAKAFTNSRENAGGIQFLSIQTTPEEERFAGFWMLREMSEY